HARRRRAEATPHAGTLPLAVLRLLPLGAGTADSIYTLLVLGHRLRGVSRGAPVLPDWQLRCAPENLGGFRCPRHLRTLSLSPEGSARSLRQPAGCGPGARQLTTRTDSKHKAGVPAAQRERWGAG